MTKLLNMRVIPRLSVRRRQIQHPVDGEYPCTDPADAGTVLAHGSTTLPATRYRVFRQIDGVNPIPVYIDTVTANHAGQPGATMVKVYVIAANDARPGQEERHSANFGAVNRIAKTGAPTGSRLWNK
jgi:hypothetical protein